MKNTYAFVHVSVMERARISYESNDRQCLEALRFHDLPEHVCEQIALRRRNLAPQGDGGTVAQAHFIGAVSPNRTSGANLFST